MTCLICRQAELVLGLTSVDLERGETKMTFQRVPALICPNCGDACLAEDAAVWLLTRAERALETGRHEAVCEYDARSDPEFIRTVENDR